MMLRSLLQTVMPSLASLAFAVLSSFGSRLIGTCIFILASVIDERQWFTDEEGDELEQYCK
jgi:hypothetical protein